MHLEISMKTAELQASAAAGESSALGMLDHQLARPRTLVVGQENDRRAQARSLIRQRMSEVRQTELTKAFHGLILAIR